jgi:hypothetical protein
MSDAKLAAWLTSNTPFDAFRTKEWAFLHIRNDGPSKDWPLRPWPFLTGVVAK